MTSQLVLSLDWHPDHERLVVVGTIDRSTKVLIITKLKRKNPLFYHSILNK